jgi:hypothetical protein
MMDDNYYFEGDPSTDSARRHLERVLKGEPKVRTRWGWAAALLAGGGAWYLWRLLQRGRPEDDSTPNPASQSHRAGHA